MNATYIISIARKLGCSIFLLPEDIIEVVLAFILHELDLDFLNFLADIRLSAHMYQVNQKMMLTLTASIMYWTLKQPAEDRASDTETGSLVDSSSNSTVDDSASESSTDDSN